MNSLCRVLIVDDEMLIRQGIINYIDWEQEGFRIVGEASNGREALQMIETLQPHILITDIVMPDIDGTELVRLAKEKYPDLEIIVLSSFEDFDYVRSTFQNGVADYILKPKLNGEELIKTLRKLVPVPLSSDEVKQRPVTVEELLEKSIRGYSITSMEERLAKGFAYDQFCIAAVYLPENKENALPFDEINKQLKQQGRLVDTWLAPDNVSDFRVMLVNFEADQLSAIKQIIAHAAKQYRTSESNISILMSVPFTSIHELKDVYKNNLLKMKDYLFYLTEEPVLIYDALPGEVNHRPFDLSQFIDLFKQKKFDIAIDSLKEHLDRLMKNYTQDIFEFKSWLENIIFNTIVLLANMKYDVEELEIAKYQYFADINEAANARQAVARFYDFLDAVQTMIAVDGSRESSTNIQALLQYIEEHYAEPLSLTTLADHFHYNPSYLSSYFSTHLHIGFSDYLNQVRIEKAKAILAAGSVPISRVSEMVGYGEPSYFCKVFKRIEGLSPGRYRKKSKAKI
ncbi:response regulator transcription factor [Sediminibacillus albus]|uniref:Two-component system, response regulator YesN n=1 Tax=Sediminibacillus albus TaxID=407036 RepID=A0A1G8Y4H3_9BACI|nr:response regulator transcription factor [Sediminibacillus albus]SDJ97045.1 two-component system, response regulator YesN [Sediminibacillus albus]